MHDITTFGAKGDGQTLCSDAINRAIEACHAAGGGTVWVPPGRYRIGTIRLLSHVTLHVEAGAVLQGSPHMADYPPLPYVSEGRSTVLIYADDAEQVTITGRGVIDGNGVSFGLPDKADLYRDFVAAHTRQGEDYCKINDLPDDGPIAHKPRPGILILFKHCRSIAVTEVNLRDAPNWCLHVACCEDVRISGLDIKSSMVMPNASGMDISLTRRVVVSDCLISGGDDGIAFSPCADGFGTGVAEDITVQNCVIEARSAGIRIGWGEGDFRRLIFQNIIIRNSNRGIGLFVRAHETIRDVTFANITIESRLYKGKWWGKAEPVHLSVCTADPARPATGAIRDVSFHQLRITGEQGIVLAAEQPGQIRAIAFNDVAMRLVPGPLQESFGGNFDLRPVADDARKVYAHDIPAFYAAGVEYLRLERCHFEAERGLPDYCRQALELERCARVRLGDVRAVAFQPGIESLTQRNCTDVVLRECEL